MTVVSLFSGLRVLSFVSSAVFSGLLYLSLTPGHEPATTWFGWAHGWTWIALAVLSLVAVRRGALPLWLAVVVVVVGGVGPFAGTAGFLVETRRRRRAAG